jgi:hypothetical protein
MHWPWSAEAVAMAMAMAMAMADQPEFFDLEERYAV